MYMQLLWYLQLFMMMKEVYNGTSYNFPIILEPNIFLIAKISL